MNKVRSLIILTLTAIAVLFLSTPAVAGKKSDDLKDLKSRLKSEQSEQDALKEKMTSVNEELSAARKSLVTLTHDLQGNQKTMGDLEKRIAALEVEETAINDRIQKDYGSMGNLILAMERIRRMPTETLIIRPGAPLETAESAILLRSILPGINARASQMKKDLESLRDVRESLVADRTQAAKIGEKLKSQQNDFKALIGKREDLYRQTRSEYEVQAEFVAQMAGEARSLEQLVTKLEKDRTAAPKKLATRSSKLPGGKWYTPVQGKIIGAFGDKDGIGAISEGIRVSGEPGAIVAAPLGGIVRFAGPFRNYGNMVIIEHDNDFHSLISGLSRIDTAVGQKISAGEPVGALAGSGAERQPTLYYELRHNGKPIDPSAKFPDLS